MVVAAAAAVESWVSRLRGQRKRAGYVNSEFIIFVAIVWCRRDDCGGWPCVVVAIMVVDVEWCCSCGGDGYGSDGGGGCGGVVTMCSFL